MQQHLTLQINTKAEKWKQEEKKELSVIRAALEIEIKGSLRWGNKSYCVRGHPGLKQVNENISQPNTSRFGSLCQNLRAEVTDYMVENRTYLTTDFSQDVLVFP